MVHRLRPSDTTASMTDRPVPSTHLDLDPHIDAASILSFDAFTNAMASHAAAVCVVTALAGDLRLGRTVTAVTSLTAEPPTLVTSITRGSALAQAIAETGGFSVAMLAEGQDEVADVFAGKRVLEDRFEAGRWDRWPSGRPKLLGAATVIDCTLSGVISLESHCLFAGTLIGAEVTENAPLLWHKRHYRGLK